MRCNGGNLSARKVVQKVVGSSAQESEYPTGNHVDSHFMPVDPKKEPANAFDAQSERFARLGERRGRVVVGTHRARYRGWTRADQGTRSRKAGGLYLLAFE